MSGASRRLASGFGGQAYARASVFLNALVTIPVLLRVWGIETYGEWLALTSLASYLMLSNFGLSSAACMTMINAVAKDALPEAARIFQVSLNILIAAMLPIGIVLIWVASVLPVRHALQIVTISQAALIAIMSLILAQIIAMTVKGLYAGAINAAGRYWLPNFVSGTMKIIELRRDHRGRCSLARDAACCGAHFDCYRHARSCPSRVSRSLCKPMGENPHRHFR